MLITLAIFVVTLQRFREQLGGQSQGSRTDRSSKSLGKLLRSRYTLNLFGYQMLSAFGTQLVIYIFLVQADARFTSEAELANFFGAFGGWRNVINLLVLLFVAGSLLNRFGLGFGLATNPITVAVMVAVMAITAIVSAPVGPILFWLATLTYVLDNFLSDAITSTSIKTAYQTLPARDRSTVETTVEGIGVPTALGLTGVLLLILNVIPSLTLTHTIFFTFIVTLAWTAVAFLVYRDYAVALLHNLSYRALGGMALSLDDSSSLAVVQKLLQSPKLAEVTLALNLLEQAEHETLGPSLISLADYAQAEIRTEALTRIARLQVHAALPVIEQRLETETDPSAKGATLRALCALTEAEAVDVMPDVYLDDPEPEIRLGAMTGLLRYGGISGILAAGLPLTFLVDDVEPKERAFAARVTGEVGLNSFYQPLLSLLEDEDFQVRLAALTAAGQVRHPRLLPLVVENLREAPTRARAMSALIASGEVALPLIGQALAGETEYDHETVRRLVRVYSQVKGERVIDLLKQHLDHPHASVQYQILSTLSLCGYRAGDGEQERLEQALWALVKHGGQVLQAKQDIGRGDALAQLRAALDQEFNQTRGRIFLLLSFVYDAKVMLGTENV